MMTRGNRSGGYLRSLPGLLFGAQVEIALLFEIFRRVVCCASWCSKSPHAFVLGRGFIRFAVFIWAAVLGLAPAPALAQDVAVPPLQARVTDTTGTLDAAAVQAIDSRLAVLEQRKGAQVAVLMVPTTGTDSIEQYALRAFEQWQLGRKSVDDGILFVIAKDDRALRIEVGYGLEGAVPDLLAGRIIREQVVPRFQAGDFAGGVLAGVDSLIRLVDGEDLPPPAASAADDESSDLWGLLFLLFFFFATIPWVAAPLVGVVLYVVWGNVFIALGGAVVAFFVSRALRAWRNKGGGGKGGPGGGGMRRRAGRIGAGGFGAGGFGGGFGGGGFGGGGGSSGGGGASGRW